MGSFLNIEDMLLIGSGKHKMVYQHPCDEGMLVKVMRPELASDFGGFKNHNIFKQKVYQGIYRQFRRELINYLQLCKRDYKGKSFIFPVEKVYGFVETNVGLGLVVEKIVGPEGGGNTLIELAKSGKLTPMHINALKVFFNDCCEKHVAFGEVNAEGIMYCENRSGNPEFVLVDGAGDKLLIPLRGLSRSINARYVRKVESRICASLKIIY